MAIAISILALVATFYQLYLQRVHNEKSLKPLGQINFIDRQDTMFVHIQNNGVGPLIIEQLTFIMGNREYTSIKDCLDIDPKSYMSIDVSASATKVILPGTYLEVFSIQFEPHEGESHKEPLRKKLSEISLRVKGRDIYNNKIVIERGFQWFLRGKAL